MSAAPRRRRTVLAAARVVALCAAACALGSCMRIPHPPPRALVYVRAVPGNASVFVDERFVARAAVLSQFAVAYPPGPHRITVTAPGHFPEDREVDLHEGTQTVRVRLFPVPD